MRVNARIVSINYSDLKMMVDHAFGECVWSGGDVFPDSSCSIHVEQPGEWTTSPPTEPGWYWYRWPSTQFAPAPCKIDKYGYEADTEMGKPVDEWGAEWWPIRIQEPE